MQLLNTFAVASARPVPVHLEYVHLEIQRSMAAEREQHLSPTPPPQHAVSTARTPNYRPCAVTLAATRGAVPVSAHRPPRYPISAAAILGLRPPPHQLPRFLHPASILGSHSDARPHALRAALVPPPPGPPHVPARHQHAAAIARRTDSPQPTAALRQSHTTAARPLCARSPF